MKSHQWLTASLIACASSLWIYAKAHHCEGLVRRKLQFFHSGWVRVIGLLPTHLFWQTGNGLVAVITASSYVSFRPSTPQQLYFIGSRYILWQLEARVPKVKLVKTLDRWKVLSTWTIWCIIYGKIMQFKTTPIKRMFLKLFSYRL